MCGIVGIIGKTSVSAPLVEGLARLEYRGYDSAGIATIHDGRIDRRRAVGKLSALRTELAGNPLAGTTGIGHTRWATHGAPSTANAHPHSGAKVAVVHNGIIENYAELREELSQHGIEFESQTDTETIAKLLAFHLAKGRAPRNAFSLTLKDLKGAFALAVLFEEEPETLYGARQGSPLAIGRGEGDREGEMFIGSDAYALAPFTNKVTYLSDGDWAVIERNRIEIFDSTDASVSREEQISDASATMVDKGEHRHFMAKEIHEQPEVIGHTLSAYIDPVEGHVRLPDGGIDFAQISSLTLSACGTAYYAACIAKYWFETFAKLPVEHDIASELRYRQVPYREGGAALFISQSGET
ncbi:MAG: glutamine--fructose-6-phosphate transaminase (isomerizing), partial [Pseudomonadota bacterium]